jgi:DNA invertase Pin-like site-specific DNA recombinase
MAGMACVFAELEKSLIAQRTTEALSERRRQGRAWNHAPFGWQVEDGSLARNESEQITLGRIRELREAGVAYNKVADTLNGEQRPTKRGGPWLAASVRSVVMTAEKMAVSAK